MKKSILFAAIGLFVAAAATSCSDSGRDGDVRNDLLDFVPDKSEIVISLNPQKILRSAGGDWTEDKGIVFGPYIEETVEAFGANINDVNEKVVDFLKIEGINPESFVFATNGGFRNWYMLSAVSDQDKLAEYLKKSKVKPEKINDFEVYDKDHVFIMIDEADKLLWALYDQDADEAVKTVKKIKTRAESASMADWTRQYLGAADNLIGVLVNFDELGINLAGLMKMTNLPADLLGGDVSYVAFSASEADHKSATQLLTLGEDGKKVALLNNEIYKNADLTAMDMLPDACASKVAFGISGKELFTYFPMLSNAIGDEAIADAVAGIVSLAFGVESVDYDSMNFYANPPVESWPVKGGAVVVKCEPAKADALLSVFATKIPGVETVDPNTVKLSLKDSDVKNLDAVYFSKQADCVLISVENLKTGNNKNDLPAGAIAYSYADNKVYGGGKFAFAADMMKSGKGEWNSEGIFGSVEYTDKCPGTLAFLCKFLSVYANEMNGKNKQN